MKDKVETICDRLRNYEKQNQIKYMKGKYHDLIAYLSKGGGYIWGTGRLGKFVKQQCEKIGIEIKGFIDSDEKRWSVDGKIFSPEVLNENDCVIIASIYYADISRTLKKLQIQNFIYYEELAYIQDGMDTYYQAFEGLFDEIESCKSKYMQIYDILEDELSKKIYSEVMDYRMGLDTDHIITAYEMSKQEGCQYFDRLITDRLNSRYTFYDVGGFDGESTLDYIRCTKGYKKILFFEPSLDSIEIAKARLVGKRDVEFINAAVGAESGEVSFNDIGGGGSFISEGGTNIVPMITLDECIDNSDSYIKLDVEGYEMAVLQGMKNAIIKYKPLLAVSVYHKPGDMHQLIGTLLSWNPDYNIYMRHYTESYADTVCYFVTKSEFEI